jgi:hypothetical protein
MTLQLEVANDFGAHLADGVAASKYRITRIDPLAGLLDKLVLDFTGVRNANSSFMNALITGLIEQHGAVFLEKVTFKGCNPVLKVLVEAAIDLGLQKLAGKAA